MNRNPPPPYRADLSPYPSPYLGLRVAVGSRHGKQDQIAPAFRAALGAHLVTPPDLDTDRFGTFSGETPRSMGAAEAARGKAALAMAATDLPRGLASEASYGPLPGGWSGHQEILLFCDTVQGWHAGWPPPARPAGRRGSGGSLWSPDLRADSAGRRRR